MLLNVTMLLTVSILLCAAPEFAGRSCVGYVISRQGVTPHTDDQPRSSQGQVSNTALVCDAQIYTRLAF
jgi:hypothetical protein